MKRVIKPAKSETEFPEVVEFWQAIENGIVIFEDVCRAIVNGYMLRNNIVGRPFKTFRKFKDIYPKLG